MGTLGTRIHSEWDANNTDILKVNIDSKVNAAVDSSALFAGLENVTAFTNMSNLYTSHTTNMEGMFEGLTNALNDLDLGDNFDTSNVTNMDYMFKFDEYLKNLNLGNKFNTSNVTSMDGMFTNCLRFLSLSAAFDTRQVNDTSGMFGNSFSIRRVRVGIHTRIDGGFRAGAAWISQDGSWAGNPERDVVGPATSEMWYGEPTCMFDGNGANSGSVPTSLIWGTSYEVPQQRALKKTGYAFDGWADNSAHGLAGNTQYPRGSTINAPADEENHTPETLYASWKRIADPTIDNITITSRSLNAMPATGNVQVTGTAPGAEAWDTVEVSIPGAFPIIATLDFSDSIPTWTAQLPVSDFTADTTGTGANYTFSATLHLAGSMGDSNTVTKDQHIDIIAPDSVDLASRMNKVSGKAMSGKIGVSGITTPAAEADDTVTITWLDNTGNAITTDTPVTTQSSSVAGHIGEFEVNWPTDSKVAKASVQVKDAIGNTSAPSIINLDRPVAPAVDAPNAPKMLNGKAPTDPVKIGGTTAGASTADSVNVRLLAAGKNASDAESGDGVGAATDVTSLDTTTNKWTSQFPAAKFSNDKIGTGAQYTFCAQLHTALNGDSAYTCAQNPVDMVAPAATELAFTVPTGSMKGTVTGKVLSSDNGSKQPNRVGEANVTLTLAWFDGKGQPLTAPNTLNRAGTPLTSTATSNTDGTFSTQWPQGVKKGDQVTVTAQDTTGNTSAPTSLFKLGEAEQPGTPSHPGTPEEPQKPHQPGTPNQPHQPGQPAKPNNGNGSGTPAGQPAAQKPANKPKQLAATGITVTSIALVALLMTGLGLALSAKPKHALHRANARR